MTPFTAELLGTALVITIGNGVVANNLLKIQKEMMGVLLPLYLVG